MYQRPSDTSLAPQQQPSATETAQDAEQQPLAQSAPGPLQLASLGAGPSASQRAYDNASENDDRDPPATQAIMDRLEDQDGPAITEAAGRYGFSEVEIRAMIVVESRGIATANAGANQADRGRNAASGLMQVTAETWRNVQNNHSELARYGFMEHRYNRRINILFGAAALADKRTALQRLGVQVDPQNSIALLLTAYNGGEGVVAAAYRSAVEAGSSQPAADCLNREHLMAGIRQYPSVYRYYLTGGGRRRNPQGTVARAVELKYLEVSRYPNLIVGLIEDDREFGNNEETGSRTLVG